MVIYNGFIAGLVFGILIGISGMCIWAMSMADKHDDDDED